jgi:hypothetical protein
MTTSPIMAASSARSADLTKESLFRASFDKQPAPVPTPRPADWQPTVSDKYLAAAQARPIEALISLLRAMDEGTAVRANGQPMTYRVAGRDGTRYTSGDARQAAQAGFMAWMRIKAPALYAEFFAAHPLIEGCLYKESRQAVQEVADPQF